MPLLRPAFAKTFAAVSPILLLAACIKGHEIQDETGPAAMDASITFPDARAEADDDAGSDEEHTDAQVVVTPDAQVDLDDAGSEPAIDDVCAEQIAEALDDIPDDLACAGLYVDVRNKIVSPDARPYAPAVPLWSDGSGKARWMMLPEGTTIDASSPSEWVFPVGTKFFKEFRVNGRRVETRLFKKIREDRWARASYEWNRDETKATRSQGGDRPDIDINGAVYAIPTERDCDLCHGGRKDRVLGFDAVSLGQEGAQGITLRDLVDEGLLDPPPTRTIMVVGDDGTGKAAPALAWMHTNCGVSCHNTFEGSEAFSSGLFLKLHPNDLDGRSSANFDAIRTAVGVAAKSSRWGSDRERIVPGSPGESLIYQLISTRGGNSRDQMPPLASRVVDRTHLRMIFDWIGAMKP